MSHIIPIIFILCVLIQTFFVAATFALLSKWHDEWGDDGYGPDDPEREDAPTLKVVGE